MNSPDVASHGQAMDRMYRHQRHIYDASRRFYLLGRDTLIRNLNPPPGGHVLEIGCGTGRNLAAATLHYPLVQFHGCDISSEMLKSAAAALGRQHLTDRVNLFQGDAACFDPRPACRRQRFDRIYFSYTLSMVPEWRKAVRHAASLLADDGELHIVDFGQCEHLPALLKRTLFAWLNLFGVTPRGQLRTELASLTEAGGNTFSLTPLHRGYAWYAVVSKSRASSVAAGKAQVQYHGA